MAKKAKPRKELLSKKEIRFFKHYVLAGIVLAILMSFFGIPIKTTISKFYGVLYMFFVPGLFIFRAAYKHKTFDSKAEEYGYPVLISWFLISSLMAALSFFFKLNMFETKGALILLSIPALLILVSIIVFYKR